MEDVHDLFKEAAMLSQTNNTLNNININATPEAIKAEIAERLEPGETQWDLIRRTVEGSMTKRFIDIMFNMPDKDFARNYLKILEHFKPKLTRAELINENTEDNSINININYLNVNGEMETKKINSDKDEA